MQNQPSPQVAYLLSFLAILVQRAGGKLVIEDLSLHAGSNLQLSMKMDVEGDKVTLSIVELILKAH